MKKIFKLTGALLALAMVIGLSSCADLLGVGLGGTEKKKQTTTETPMEYVNADTPINHEFYLSDDKSSYIYYTSTTRFTYENHNDCVYQISFTPSDSAATKGTWKLYTRERAGKTIEMIYEGTFKGIDNGSVRKGGTVQLLIGTTVVDTITVENRTVQLTSGNKQAYACIVNVASAHKAIGAKDAK